MKTTYEVEKIVIERPDPKSIPFFGITLQKVSWKDGWTHDMPLVENVDYPNKRIYLHQDTIGLNVLPVDVYKEVRALRRQTPNHRKFLPLIRARGNEPVGPTNTPIFTILSQGARIVPYDISHTVEVGGALVNIDENLAGPDLVDRSPLSPSTQVDVSYDAPQVEVIEVATGGLTPAQSNQIEFIYNQMFGVEGALNSDDVLRILLAAMAGKADGANTNQMNFRDQADTKNRIVATIDQHGNRSSISIDPSE